MRTAIGLHDFVFKGDGDFGAMADRVAEAERLGVRTVWSAEAWGTDAFVPLAFLAGRTSTIRLATGIAQVTARTPVTTAMTAMTLDSMSGGRLVLGLGVSGPQVVEGLHGQRYDRPLERLRETVDVIRMAMRGDKVEYHGRQIDLPRPGGQGKALRLSQPPRPDVPIHIASLGPKTLEYTGQATDGWVSTCFVPETSAAYLDHLRAGAARAGRPFSEVEVMAGAPVAFSDDLERLYASRRKALAFQISAMGSPTTNFYFEAYARMGFGDECTHVRNVWLEGRHDDACAAVPEALVRGTSLFGTPAEVRARIRQYREAGVTDLRIEPMGRTPDEKLATLAQAVELVDEVTAETSAGD